MLTKVLLWLGGVDSDLLGKCAYLPKSERHRLAAIGGTVCIPAMFAFAAWGYAAFTFIQVAQLAVAFGAVGAVTILWLDRLLVMTCHKSGLDSAASFWFAAAARVALSCVLSYGLAEPLTLLVFQGPIKQQMADDGREREEAAFRKADTLRAEAIATMDQERSNATRDLSAQLQQKTNAWACMNALASLEMAGGVAAGTPVKGSDGTVCGFASGKEGCKAQCGMDITERDQLAADVRRLRGQIQARLDSIDASSVSAATQESQRLQNGISAETTPTDFAARTGALSEVEAKSPAIKGVHHFLIFALMLLDSIVLLIKAMIPTGEYEEQRDTALAIARASARTERAATVSWLITHGGPLQHERLSHEATKKGIVAILQAANQMLEEQSHQFQLFRAQINRLERLIVEIKNDEDRRACMELLVELQRTFNQGWTIALEKFRTDIGVL